MLQFGSITGMQGSSVASLDGWFSRYLRRGCCGWLVRSHLSYRGSTLVLIKTGERVEGREQSTASEAPYIGGNRGQIQYPRNHKENLKIHGHKRRAEDTTPRPPFAHTHDGRTQPCTHWVNSLDPLHSTGIHVFWSSVGSSRYAHCTQQP